MPVSSMRMSHHQKLASLRGPCCRPRSSSFVASDPRQVVPQSMLGHVAKMRSVVLCACFTLLCGSALGIPSIHTLPVFLWGSGDYIQHEPQQSGLQASYEVSSADALAGDILGDSARTGGKSTSSLLNRTALGPFDQNLVTVFVLGELRRSDLSQRQGVAARLSEAVKSAASSIFLSDLQSTHEELVKQVRAKSVVLLEIGECGAGGQSTILENIQSEFDKHTGRVSIVLCNNQLLDPFKSITEGLEGAGRPFAVVYVGQPEQELSRPVARSLLATTTSNAKDLCDRKCRIQVRLFEVIILLIFLLVALYAGLSMLHILDTPTRFEQEKKETNRHHD